MKEFTLDTPSRPISPAQRNAIYWRAWEAAEAAPPGLNRFAITRRVLGRVIKIKDLTDNEFKKLVRAFGHIAKRSVPPAADDQDSESCDNKRDADPRSPSAAVQPRKRIRREPANMIRIAEPHPRRALAIQAIGYPASQLAPAIGLTATRIRQRLGASGKINDAGVRVWPLKDLPPEWMSKLSARRRAAGFASDEEWTSSRKPWESSIPFAEIIEKLRDAANQRRDIFAPILRALGEEPISQITRAVRDCYRAARLNVPNERTLRRWIETAMARDDGRCDFDRPELYLQGRLVRRCSHRQDDPPVVVASWADACHFYSSLIAQGETPVGAQNTIRRVVRQSPLGAGMSADAVRKAVSRKIGKWGTDAALTDRRKDSSGRRPKFTLCEKEIRALQWYRLRKQSLYAAIIAFRNHPKCRPETRVLIEAELDNAARARRQPAWPLSLRRAGEVTPEQEARFRSKRAFREVGYGDRRGNFWINDAGDRVPLLANTLWESDDMSVNEPFQFMDPETGSPSLGRQVIATIDVLSAAFLGASPIGRSKDAYRVEDIADHMRDCIIEHGLPLMWRLERGPWENNFIDGFPLSDGTRWGGLGEIIRIVRAFGPQSKGQIESRFNQLQRILAHESTSIGRKRGEFAAATKLANRARNGGERALAKFWDITAAADGIASAMKDANLSPMRRRAFGKQTVVPAELYRSASKKICAADQLWRFCPVKRPATIRKCAIEASVMHYPMPFRFRVNGDDGLYLPHGYRVLIAFHPGHPELGCHIFNGEEGARNFSGFRRHEFIRIAPLAEDAPQVNYSRDDQQFISRKRANAQVSSEFRAITSSGVSCSRVSTRRDGFGNSIVRAVGAAGIENERARGLVNRQDPGSRRGGDMIKTALSHFDEDAELRHIKKLEREAVARGDIILRQGL